MLNVGSSGGGNMHVSSNTLSTSKKGERTDAKATVVIVDESGAPVFGASVSGNFPGGVSGSKSRTTGSTGRSH